ncbi:hypothetical protein ABC502_01650 [Alkalimonas sp. NCh-2]|uniref:hypothetical protein n=1 Tax=Alkalimonas sp. NCh-2 TaxID=3144846 RepID=UPI0031F6A1D5
MSTKLPFKRAIAAIGGSAGMALTSLVLALCLMQQASVEAYGLFAFLLITQALANGFSNAMLGSPLLIALSELEGSDNDDAKAKVHSFMLANVLLCLVFAVIQASIVYSFTKAPWLSSIYAFSAFITTLRWFGRSYCNNSHQHSKVVISDACYSALSLVGACALFFTQNVSLESFGILTAAAALLATPLLGSRYLKPQFTSAFRAGFKGFREGWNKQGKHALVGVLTTEGTLNSHSYMVTFFFGPAAFAPIAAAGLLFRPVMVVLTSLAQIERPRLRQLLSKGFVAEAKISLVRYRAVNAVFWFLNCIIAAIVLLFFIDLYWKDSQSVHALLWAALLFALIRGSRSLSSTYSVFLQAADQFKALSLVTVKTSLLTIPLVFISLQLFEPSFSLIGILMGELVAFSLLVRLYRGVK